MRSVVVAGEDLNMQALTRLQDTLWGLLAQGEESVLLLRCRDFDVPLVHKVIEVVDQESPSDVFLSFSLPMDDDTAQYVSAVMDSLSQQIAGANVLRQSPMSWALPSECFIGSPAARLDAAFGYIESLLPAGDHRILWSFVPAQIGHDVAWTNFVTHFVAKSDRPRHRVVLRANDDIIDTIRGDAVASAFLLDVDFSPEAMANDLAHTALDPNSIPKDRHFALLQLAGMDFAHRRYVEAAKKYGLVYAFFDTVDGSEGIRAMCLVGVAEVARVARNFSLAKKRYQQALALAAPQVDTITIAMTCCDALGDLCSEAATDHLGASRSEALEEARGYYTLASTIAGKLCNQTFKADLLEKIGIVQIELGRHEQGLATWREGLRLADDVEYSLRVESLAHRLASRGAP